MACWLDFSRRARILTALWLLVLGLVSGVSGVSAQALPTADLDRVKAGQLAAVMFQIKTNINGKVVSPQDTGDSNRSTRLYLANLSERNPPQLISASFPSKAAAAEGWRQLLLPPGTYYLLVLPPGLDQNPPAVAFHAPSARFGRLTQYKFEPARGGFWSLELRSYVLAGASPPDDFRELPGFWFQVPDKTPVVYLGTLSTACTDGRGLFGSLIDACSDFSVSLDQDAAQRVSALAMPGTGTGPVQTEQMTVYGKARDGLPLRERGTVKVVMQPPATLSAAFTGAKIAPSDVLQGASREIAVYNLLAMASEAAVRAAAQRKAEQQVAQVQPCMAQLASALPAIDYTAQFADALAHAVRLGESGLTPLQLTISAPTLQLRESSRPHYLALELGLQLRLENLDSKRTIYESLLLYAEGFSVQNPLDKRARLYERLVAQRAQPRLMEEWCGATGGVLLKEDIETGLKHIAAQLVKDLE
jgi:hypothetical protein